MRTMKTHTYTQIHTFRLIYKHMAPKLFLFPRNMPILKENVCNAFSFFLSGGKHFRNSVMMIV